MKEDFHIDLSNKFFTGRTTGIACVRIPSKKHQGCALSKRFKRDIEKAFIKKRIKEGHAKLYAICIYYLIKDNLQEIERLVICNDENFKMVKGYLHNLIGKKVKIISIFDFRKTLDKNVKSPADNYARAYSYRGLRRFRWDCGRKLNVVRITYEMVEKKWKKCK